LVTYYIVIIAMPYFNHAIWNAQFGPALTVTKLAGAVCLVYSFLHLARRHGIPKFLASPQAKWMIVFFSIATFSFISNEVSTAGDVVVNPIYTYWSTLIFFFITMIIIDSVKRLYWSCLVALGSVSFASLYVLREWQQALVIYGGGYRPGWVVGDANYFTVAALAVLPLGFELLLVTRNKLHKLYCLGCMALIFLAITLGASRGGFLGVAIDTIYLISRSRQPLKNAVRMGVFVLPLLLLLPSSPLRRFMNPERGDTESVTQHLAGWQAGLVMIQQHPFAGVGLGNYKPTVVHYNSIGLAHADPHIAHNGFLEVAAEMGLPAFAVYLIFFGTTLYSTRKTEKLALARGEPMLAAIALGMQAAVLGSCVAIFFVSGEYTKLLWLILCLTMAMPALVPARAAAKQLPLDVQPEPEPEPAFKVGEALVEMR
jgi:O-antigen ligase